MPEKFQDKYRVSSARAPWHDYSASGIYFLTICTAAREPLLAHVLQGVVHLTAIGNIAKEEWESSFCIRGELTCDAYVMMPNHIHALVRLDNGNAARRERGEMEREPKSISSFISAYKAAVTRRVRRESTAVQTVWQSRFHDRIIRNRDEYQVVMNYIKQNPKDSPDYLNPQYLIELVETHGNASPDKNVSPDKRVETHGSASSEEAETHCGASPEEAKTHCSASPEEAKTHCSASPEEAETHCHASEKFETHCHASLHPEFFPIPPSLETLAARALSQTAPRFAAIDALTEHNQQKVLAAFIKHRVSETHFAETTGYGYGDRGRETLEAVLAEAMGCESALMRHSFVSGTHTLAVALFGLLRPGDTMLCVTGAPYDTLRPVIGLTGSGMGSLKDFGVKYEQVDLTPQGRLDYDAIERAIKIKQPKLVYLQRSRGYTLRPSLSVEEIGQAAQIAKEHSDATVMVDNCYGEFVQREEPTQCGADIIAGSLIKNPGGGLAKNGGYIAGRADLVDLCAYRMTTPGIGREVGATLGLNRGLFMGLFNAPHVVGEALKTAVFAAALLELMGYDVAPRWDEPRHDIIQSVTLGSAEKLIAFCRGIQSGAPVDAHVTPAPWDMPGYDNQVIMAAGAFTMGASIELSADAPLREPYAAWLQGGLNFHSAKVGVLLGARGIMGKA